MAKPHWDTEIDRVIEGAQHMVTHHKATAIIGVAVDDNEKRDYFRPRLQAMLDTKEWARHLTMRIVPISGTFIELKRQEILGV